MSFERDVAVVGAGRIGLPWAAVLAATLEIDVTCIDIDESRVEDINQAEAPFAEPGLQNYLETAVDSGCLRATTDASHVSDHEFVAFTINAPREDTSLFIEALRTYADELVDGQVVVSRSTLPVGVVERSRELLAEIEPNLSFTVFPERLAEGKAIEEIRSLPKIIGTDDERGREALEGLLAPLGCSIQTTDPETAMLVKLIDNSYRDALFSISNQIAYTADQLGLDAHEAIELANFEYDRNDIPTPGTVGGKCLPKDPHFLTDERVCDQPATPDLFYATRRTNARLQSYVTTELLRRQPGTVAVLGVAYKRAVGDTFNSPAHSIVEALQEQGVVVSVCDPHVAEYDSDIEETLSTANTVVLAVNHPEFEGIEELINYNLSADGLVYDVWGMLNGDEIDATYDGFGITPS